MRVVICAASGPYKPTSQQWIDERRHWCIEVEETTLSKLQQHDSSDRFRRRAPREGVFAVAFPRAIATHDRASAELHLEIGILVSERPRALVAPRAQLF
jgi:hypothetical protein